MVGLAGLLISSVVLVVSPSLFGSRTSGSETGSPWNLAGGPPNTCVFRSTVTLPVDTGPAGGSYWVNGTDYYYAGPVTVYWVQGPVMTGTYQEVGTAPLEEQTPDVGNFSGIFTLPPSGPGYSAGSYYVVAEDNDGDCGDASFTTTTASPDTPQLTIEYPESGIGGTATSVDGLYFSTDATIAPITMGGDTLACSGGSPETSSVGAFTCDFTVPATLSAGSYPVIATDPTYGPITSTNEFIDSGGQTTTSIDCSPNPIGTYSSSESFFYLWPSSNCTATVTDPGSTPTGTVSWSSSSTTGVFFTWLWTGVEYDYTPTTTCTLDTASQCVISYADSDPGFPTITGDYSGDYNNQAGSGTDSLLVVPITTPTVTVSCNPSFVTKSSSCTADVTGSSPTGLVSWAATNEYAPSKTGSFASASCSLIGGSCSVTYYPPAPYIPLCSGLPPDCGAPIFIGAQYHGDALNAPAYGSYTVVTGTTGNQYAAYSDGLQAYLPTGSGCTWCDNTSGPFGGFGVQTVGLSEHVNGEIGGPHGAVATSDAFAVMGSAPKGEISATGTSNADGDANGDVYIVDQVTVTGVCDVPGNIDPGDLLDCLGISLSVSGNVHTTCDDPDDGGCQGKSTATVGGTFGMCDIDQPQGSASTEICASGSVGAAACSGAGCFCPGTSNACNNQGGASVDFQSPSPVFLRPGAVIQSGDTLDLYDEIGGQAAASDWSGTAGLTIDPSWDIVNLDPSSITVSVGAAEVIALSNPSVLQLSSSIVPSPVAAGGPVEDTTVLTNTGSSALTNITASGSMDGPLSCPTSPLPAGDHETCSGTFSPAATGAQTDVIIANGTNATDGDVDNGTTADFVVTPTPYNVTFNETGLAPGTSWTVILNGTPRNSSTPTITFSEPYGPYSYEVIPPVGSTATPSNGSVFVYNGPTGVNATMHPGLEGPVIGAIAELYAVYDQRPDLQAAFPDANASASSFIGLVGWAGSVVEGQTSDSNYTTLAPYGFYYTLMATYNGRADLQSHYPNVYGVWKNFTLLLDWAGNVVNDSFVDTSASTLAPFGPWYALMLTYDNRTDLEAAFPNALTNYTNFTELVNWAGEVVNESFVDSANSTLQKFGYYYDLMMVYYGRPDLQAAFPDVFTNWTSEQALIWWAGAVVNGTITDSSNTTLQAFGYWYELFGLVYENRADLLAAYPLADTDGASYHALIVWAADVVLGDFTDSAYVTLLPYASEYESLA